MTLQEAYAHLKDCFGSHRAAAEHLKMTEQHYNALRNGRANMPAWREDQIILKASKLESCQSPAVPPMEPKSEARP